MGKKYAYVYVPNKEQCDEQQLIAFRLEGIDETDIYIDMQNGKDLSKPRYDQLVCSLGPEDVLFVYSIDCLGNDYEEIMNQWEYITVKKQANIVVLDMPLLDTRQQECDLTGISISKLVLQILDYIKQTEQKKARKRQADGIAAAMQRGVRFGRKAVQVPKGFEQIAEQWQQRHQTSAEIAKQLGISRSLLYKWLREYSLERGIDGNDVIGEGE